MLTLARVAASVSSVMQKPARCGNGGQSSSIADRSLMSATCTRSRREETSRFRARARGDGVARALEAVVKSTGPRADNRGASPETRVPGAQFLTVFEALCYGSATCPGALSPRSHAVGRSHWTQKG